MEEEEGGPCKMAPICSGGLSVTDCGKASSGDERWRSFSDSGECNSVEKVMGTQSHCIWRSKRLELDAVRVPGSRC